MWYLYTMEFYSATKKNEVLTFASKWMELDNIILCKINQVQRQKSYVLPHIQALDLKQIAVILLDMGHTPRGEHI
jgi:hypothetical protein